MKKVFFFFSSPERSQQIRPCVNKEASFASFAYSDVLIDIEHLQPTLSYKQKKTRKKGQLINFKRERERERERETNDME